MKKLLRGCCFFFVSAVLLAGIGKVCKADTIEMTVNEDTVYELDFKNGFNDYKLKFTPGRTGRYIIESTGSGVKNVTLYNSDNEELISTDSNRNNFRIFYELTKDKSYTYHVTVKEADVGRKDATVKLSYVEPDSPSVVEVNENTFPDIGFRNHVLTHYDIYPDKVLTRSEISNANRLYYDDYLFKDITGVKYLSDLTYIRLDYYGFGDIDVSGLTKLEYLALVEGKMGSLDCSGCTSLKTLYAHGNKDTLKKVNVSGCSELVYANFNTGHLTDIDLTSCSNLEELRCGSQADLKIIDLSHNPKLKVLYVNLSGIEQLDLSNNQELEELRCDNCNLTNIDLNSNTKLRSIYCQYNGIGFLDTSNCRNLELLHCAGNPIKDKKVYIPHGNIDTNQSSFSYLVLDLSDWVCNGIIWTGDFKNGFSAVARYTCSKVEDYSCDMKMEIEHILTPAQCEKDGSDVYKAMIASDLARDGVARSDSKKEVLPPTGHDWGDWTVTKKASIGKDGEETRICKNDSSHKQTRKIMALTPTPTATPAANQVSLKLDKSSANVVCGNKVTLKATVNGTKKTVSWKSSDAKVAAVDARGKVTAKMAGTVTITATVEGKKAACTVTVLYKDVTNSKDFWYEPTNAMTAKGVVKGYEKQTKFKPANMCTRAQMVTFIWRLAGEPKPKTAKCKFSDVKKTDYFYKACLWGNENHIVEGYKDGTFGPQIVCARRHAVTFLWRLAGQPDPKTKANKFKDVKEKDYFYKATLWASEKKILAGYDDGTFRPNGNCLRRQMVTFLYKYDKFVNGKG